MGEKVPAQQSSRDTEGSAHSPRRADPTPTPQLANRHFPEHLARARHRGTEKWDSAPTPREPSLVGRPLQTGNCHSGWKLGPGVQRGMAGGPGKAWVSEMKSWEGRGGGPRS